MNKKNKLAKPIEYKITDYMQKFINSLKSFGLKVNVESGGGTMWLLERW